MGEQITFWYGCNVLRHGDIIHSCLDILRLLGMDAQPAGGPDYCCGTAKDDNQTAADGMARRTVTKFNAIGRERVVAWCPSCHSHMTEFMGQAYKPEFGLSYLVDVLYEKRAALSALLKHPVPMRVLLHKHVGFNDQVAVNEKVPALLELIPGIEVVDDGYAAPGYMCAMLSSVPSAMAEMNRETLRRVALHRADAVVTIFHQCYREICGLEAHANTKAFNYIHLLAQSIGLDYVDEYKAWKKSGPNAAELIGEQRLAQVGVQFFERAMLPELVKRPIGLDPKPPESGK
ncbi:MAG TPA: heterodisulfide reductase-related iron-sulfur binding cluster [Burkholderiales bacterium]|jgi:Fe-S oxidoreductase|nr:heterodisulfide reductase-related iron-sulfur binding cluster [Burkholderiales bacterium]